MSKDEGFISLFSKLMEDVFSLGKMLVSEISDGIKKIKEGRQENV